MEIKKGISQMAEYPNKEINYVVPADGKMYYVLDDGVLENGTIIATLNAKRVVDSTVVCNDMGAFKEDGSVLIDFNKEDIKKINEDLLLTVNSIPETNEVLDSVSKESDAINKALIEDNMAIIESKVKDEMGPNGEVIFADPFKEVSVYKTDSYNNKVGISCSFVGKNDTNLYFHTNLVNSETTVVSLSDASLSDVPIVNTDSSSDVTNNNEEEITEDVDNANLDLKLDINDSILSGFTKKEEIEETKTTEDIEEESTNEEQPSEDFQTTITAEDIENQMNGDDKEEEDESDDTTDSDTNSSTSEEDDEEEEDNKNLDFSNNEESDSENDKVLDNAIETMKKLIDETARLKEKINVLEEELARKNKVLDEEDAKKDTLSDLLDEANDALKDSE